jgi:hypothetical protein
VLLYSDTDSLHIINKYLKDIEKKYKDKYGMELNGKNIGQFHVDLENPDGDPCIATNSIFLGKKMYIDKIIRISDIHKKNPEFWHHIRLKGVGSKSVIQTAKELGISPFDIYKKLYNGEKICFDIAKSGLKLEHKLYRAYVKNKFIREISV